jgi:predicted GNAT family N-acyltransferase
MRAAGRPPVTVPRVEAVELDMVGSAEWSALLAGEPQAFGGVGEELSWMRKTRHVAVLDESGKPLALAGAVLAQVAVAGGEPFPVVGIGGVIVTRAMRGRGLARLVLEAILAVARELGPERAALFCSEQLTTLYARFGFQLIDAPVTAEQPRGHIVVPMRAMWAPLVAGSAWPAGAVEVLGEPF